MRKRTAANPHTGDAETLDSLYFCLIRDLKCVCIQAFKERNGFACSPVIIDMHACTVCACVCVCVCVCGPSFPPGSRREYQGVACTALLAGWTHVVDS